MIFNPLNFNLYHSQGSGGTPFSSVCPWTIMVDDGVVLNKGGSLSCAYEFIAPDIGSASIGKINAISTMFNSAVIQLGSNWTIQFELQRRISNDYPGGKHQTLAGYLVEKQRERNFSFLKAHFQNRYYVIFTYLMPPEVEMKSRRMFYKKKNMNKSTEFIQNEVKYFKMNASKSVAILSSIMHMEALHSEQLAELLHSSVSMDWHKISLPEEYKLFLDRIITDEDLDNSIPLKLGKNYIPIVAINSFPSLTMPAMFDSLNKAACELRWSTRFTCYSKENAIKRITSAENKFHSARKSMGQMVLESVGHINSTKENSAAIVEENDAARAKEDVTMGNIGFGDYTSNVMVWDKQLGIAEDKAKYVAGLITSCGFTVKEESHNALHAFLSMQPGNIYANSRNLFVSTGNMSHVIPVSSIWAGLKENNFMHDICGCSIPHVVCGTEFGIPFFLNLNVNDVGHTWISGRTGAGKSTLLALLEIEWLKYPDAQVVIFDKDRSARTLTMCVGGSYIEPGLDETTFQPLSDIDTPDGLRWACEFIQLLLAEQKVNITASIRNSIYDAMKLLQTMDKSSRTLTSFSQYCDYQNPSTHENDITVGISPYVLGGQYGSLFDSQQNSFNVGKWNWSMIEMGALMKMSSHAVAPALFYLFRECEKKFDGSPVLLVLDEAWIFLKNPIFATKISEWLKVLRKKHVFVVFATQEINDAIASPIANTIVSQCVTKIYLADEEAQDEMNSETYRKFGLENSEIRLISQMRRKMDYFYKSTMGTRRFQLDLDPLQLAILTGSIDDTKFLDALEKKYGRNTGKDFIKEILSNKKIDFSYLMDGENYEMQPNA